MSVMFIFMNTGSAAAAIHVMMDVVHASVNAKSAKTEAWRALLHHSVKQITNDVETCNRPPSASSGPSLLLSWHLVLGATEGGAAPILAFVWRRQYSGRRIGLFIKRRDGSQAGMIRPARCGAALVCRRERRSRHGRLSWTVRLV
jgi:hypothetical protein